jgi:hypothetical protein
VRLTDYGLIVHAPLVQAYGHDSTCRDDLLAGVHPATQVLGDAAFLDLERQQELNDTYQIRLLTPLRANIKPTPARQPFVLPKCSVSQIMSRLHKMAYPLRAGKNPLLFQGEDPSHAWSPTHLVADVSGRLFAASPLHDPTEDGSASVHPTVPTSLASL